MTLVQKIIKYKLTKLPAAAASNSRFSNPVASSNGSGKAIIEIYLKALFYI